MIQRLDDNRLTFRERALRLVGFAASGVLTVGKATTIARDTIVSYLRRKDFINEFTADIPEPTEKERAIKEFYGLLAGTGFDMKDAESTSVIRSRSTARRRTCRDASAVPAPSADRTPAPRSSAAATAAAKAPRRA